MTPLIAQAVPFFVTAGLAAAGAAAVAIPVAIHLLTRLRRRPQPWAAMRFLLEAYRKQKQRLQLEQLLLLLVRCLIVLVLGLALAEPLVRVAWGSTGDSEGRTICIVLDDSLSTRADPENRGASGARFEHLRQTALRLIDGLQPADRVGIWLAARPTRGEVVPPTLDRTQVRRALEAAEPRFARADWPAALVEVRNTLTDRKVSADRAVVVMLSDFAAGTLDLERSTASELADLGQRARLLVSRPMPEAANVQIAALTPRRSMVLAESAGTGATLPLEVRLRRFATDTADAMTGIDVIVTGDDPNQPLATARREHRWAAGQATAVVNVELPVPVPQGGAAPTLSVAVRIDPGSTADALAADNERFAVVELRQRLGVAVIDEGSAAAVPTTDGAFLRPAEWIGLALSPSVGGTRVGPIEVTPLSAPAVDEASLKTADAALVLRPDLLSPGGWDALKALAERGGLVWLFAPAAEAPGMWSNALKEKLGLDWRVSMEPKLAPAPEDEKAPGSWAIAESAAPEPLNLLATDWGAMLRPVRVSKRLELSTRNVGETWLRVDTGSPDSPDALLASAPVGDGRVLLLATAIDTTWTNLPTKPLLVPLLHETLRGVLGNSGEASRLGRLTAGDQPLLGRRWDEAESLVSPKGGSVQLRRTDRGLEPVSALELPGVYAAKPSSAGLKLALSADADAGNTAAIDAAALEKWLADMGNWSYLAVDEPKIDVAAQAPRTNLGWRLLAVVLALVLAETALAKWFSHAKA